MREFSNSDVAARVPLPALVDEVDRCLSDLGTGAASQLPKAALPFAGDGFFLTVAGIVPRLGLATAKWASYKPGASGAPGTSTSTIIASDATTGEPRAAILGMWATHARTAATAVAVARRWATIDAHRLAFVGFGPTNRAVLETLDALDWTLPEVAIAVRSNESAQRLRSEFAELGRNVCVTTDVAEAVRGADLAISATGSRTSVANVTELATGGIAISLDGSATWKLAETTVAVNDRALGLAELFASTPGATACPTFFDIAGSAVTDVALAAILLGGEAA